jgi:hypothetical protein
LARGDETGKSSDGFFELSGGQDKRQAKAFVVLLLRAKGAAGGQAHAG